MKDLKIIPLNQENVHPFTAYLLPQVFQLVEAGEKLLLLGACAAGHSLGAMAAAEKDGTMMIRSLYVDKAVRRKGVGSALLKGMAQSFAAREIPVKAAAAEYMVIEGENADDIAAFLRACGFERPEAGNRLFEVDTRLLRRRPLLKKAFGADYQVDSHVTHFSALTPQQMYSIETSDAQSFLKPSRQSGGFLKPASVAWVQGDQVMGWILLRQGFDREIILSAAYVRKEAPAGCFMRLLEAAAHRAYLMLGRDFRCYISTISDYVSTLVDKVAGSEKKEYENYVVRTGHRTPRWLR